MSAARSASVPALRLRTLNPAPVRPDGDFVLYWMIAARRAQWNYALDRALERCEELGKPLVVLEALRCAYPWASLRLHRFILEGMADNARAFSRAGMTYYPYVEPSPGEGRGLLETLSKRACVVVTDEYPCFFLPAMAEAAARRVAVLLEQVDSNGLLPLHASPASFATAHSFRRFLQKELPAHLAAPPRPDPLGRRLLPEAAALPRDVLRRWPPAEADRILSPAFLDGLPLDRAAGFAPARGGSRAASQTLARFLERNLPRYAECRNDLDDEAASGLSPYLHFGHASPHEVFAGVASRESWNPGRLSPKAVGARQGWWGMSPPAEAFLDQLVTWRELGFAACVHDPAFERLESLPPWARQTLENHSADARPHLYDLGQFEGARTHDPLWNAAQRQLLSEGRIHNYLRMLWGKKVLEWSPSAREALATMIELNNKYALDGRDPNSYSGILWVLGKYDRPWGPARPVYGTARYMSSQNTARKMDVRGYLKRHGA